MLISLKGDNEQAPILYTFHGKEKVPPAMTEIMHAWRVLLKVISLNPVKRDFTFRLNHPKYSSGQESKFDARNHESKSERSVSLSFRCLVTAQRTALWIFDVSEVALS